MLNQSVNQEAPEKILQGISHSYRKYVIKYLGKFPLNCVREVIFIHFKNYWQQM